MIINGREVSRENLSFPPGVACRNDKEAKQ
jgi:hypothetical protein